MKKVLALGMAVALIAAAGAAMAYPSLLGPTGGTNLPSAKVIQQGTLGLAYDLQKGQTVDGIKLGNTNSFRLLYGIVKDSELGFTFNKEDVSGASKSLDNWGVNAKYAFPAESMPVNVALGAVYGKFKDADINVTQIYAVGSHLFTSAKAGASFRGSLGLNWTKFDVVGSNTDAVRPYINLDLGLAKGVTFTAEWQAKKSSIDDKSLMSFVVRYPVTQGLNLELGTTNSVRGVAGGPDQEITFGFNWNYAASAK